MTRVLQSEVAFFAKTVGNKSAAEYDRLLRKEPSR